MPRDSFVIETHDLTKAYKGVQALRSLDLKVPKHSIFGFLGRTALARAPPSSSCSALLAPPLAPPASSIRTSHTTASPFGGELAI